MPAAKKAKLTKTVKTRFGTVDRKGYEDLRDSYDTFALLAAMVYPLKWAFEEYYLGGSQFSFSGLMSEGLL